MKTKKMKSKTLKLSIALFIYIGAEVIAVTGVAVLIYFAANGKKR